MKTTIKIEGLKELDAALQELPRASAKGVARRILTRAAEHIAEEARRLAPDDPNTPAPDLHTSIAVSARQKGGGARRAARDAPWQTTVYMGPTGEGYPQAIMQEFGTRHHAPRPYMRPAWDNRQHEALAIIVRDLGGEIDKTAKRVAKRAARLVAKGL